MSITPNGIRVIQREAPRHWLCIPRLCPNLSPVTCPSGLVLGGGSPSFRSRSALGIDADSRLVPLVRLVLLSPLLLPLCARGVVRAQVLLDYIVLVVDILLF